MAAALGTTAGVNPPAAPRGGQRGYLASLQDRDGMRCVDQRGAACLVRSSGQGRRGVCDGHEGKVFGLVVLLRIVVVCIEARDLGRGFRGTRPGYVDDQGLVDRLAAGEVGVEGPAHLLLGPQDSLLGLCVCIARQDAQGEVWGIEAPAQRVAVFPEDHLAHVVDQVVLADLHQGGRGVLALDPDLAVQHAGVEVGAGGQVVVGLGGRAWGWLCRGSSGRVWCEQRLYSASIRGRYERLAAGGQLGGAVVWMGRLGGGLDGGMHRRGLLEGEDGTGGVRVVGQRCCRRAAPQPDVAGRALRFGPTAAGAPKDYFRLREPLGVAVAVAVVGGRRCRQLGQRDALAQATPRALALAARRRVLRRRRRDLAVPPEQLGSRVVEARLDARHGRAQPTASPRARLRFRDGEGGVLLTSGSLAPSRVLCADRGRGDKEHGEKRATVGAQACRRCRRQGQMGARGTGVRWTVSRRRCGALAAISIMAMPMSVGNHEATLARVAGPKRK